MTDPNAPPPPPSGIVLVDKPASWKIKSMTVVRSVKRRLILGGFPKSIKVGHAGTLDPLASGLLIVLVGRATRWCERLMAQEKEYIADIDLSRWSPTDDLEKEPHENPPLPGAPPAPERVEAVLREQFTGTIQQRPPAYSAMWVDGERAYHLARAGDLQTLAARPVIIHDLRVIEYSWPNLRIDVRCGKGTYIRSMARDIGLALTGHPAVLTGLRRTAILPYRVENATPLEELPERMTPADLRPMQETGSD